MTLVERKLTIPGTLEEVRVACDFVAEFAEEINIGEEGVYHCRLCVEEICTNIVEHGYEFNGDDKTIEIICRKSGDMLSISVFDEAVEFNPLIREDPDPDAPLWERNLGGWGIYFVKQFMDDIRYQYTDNRNQLIIEKRLA